jgi:hypothetical protein
MAVPERGLLRLALVTARRAVIIWSDDRSGMNSPGSVVQYAT